MEKKVVMIRVMSAREKYLMSVAGLFVIVLGMLTQVGCATNPAYVDSRVREMKPKMEMEERVSDSQSIGVVDDYAMVRERRRMTEVLRTLQNDVYSLEAKVYGGPRYYDNRGQYGILKECRTRLGDIDNGGEGKLRWMETRDYVTPEYDHMVISSEYKRNLVGETEEKLGDRITRFRGYKNVLEQRSEDFDTKIQQCQLELKSQQRVASH